MQRNVNIPGFERVWVEETNREEGNSRILWLPVMSKCNQAHLETAQRRHDFARRTVRLPWFKMATSPSTSLDSSHPNKFPAYRIAVAGLRCLAVIFGGCYRGTDIWSSRDCIAVPSFHSLSPQRRSGKHEPGQRRSRTRVGGAGSGAAAHSGPCQSMPAASSHQESSLRSGTHSKDMNSCRIHFAEIRPCHFSLIRSVVLAASTAGTL